MKYVTVLQFQVDLCNNAIIFANKHTRYMPYIGYMMIYRKIYSTQGAIP